MSERLSSDDLIEQLARNLKPARIASAAGRAAIIWAAVAIAASACLVFLGPGARPDLMVALLSPQMLLTLVVLAALAATAATLALTLARPGREAHRAFRYAPWVLLAMLVGILASYGLDGDRSVAIGFATSGLQCSGILCLAAALPGVALFAMTRRLAALKPASAGATIGLAAAAAGGLGLALHCPSTNVWHLLVYHALPIGVVAVGTAIAGARWLRW